MSRNSRSCRLLDQSLVSRFFLEEGKLMKKEDECGGGCDFLCR